MHPSGDRRPRTKGFASAFAALFCCSQCWTHPVVGLPQPEDAAVPIAALLGLLGGATGDAAPDEDVSSSAEPTFTVRSADADGAPTSITCSGNAIFLAGFSRPAGNDAWRLEKRNRVSGELDPDFGVGGVLTFDHSGNNDSLDAIATDGVYVYLGGYERSSGNGAWRVEKRTADTGALVTGFGAGGELFLDHSGNHDLLHSLILTDDSLYLGGIDSNSRWRVEKRNPTDGAYDTNFAGTGFRNDITTFTGSLVSIYDMALHSGQLFLGGAEQGGPTVQWRVTKLDAATGGELAGFGTGGSVFANPSSSHDEVASIVTDGSAVYYTGDSGSNQTLRLEKRAVSDGSSDAGFGASGLLESDPGAGDDQWRALALQDSMLISVGWDSATSGGDREWRIAMRDNASGALIPGFGSGGVIQTDLTGGEDRATVVCADSNFVYVAGSESGSPDSWRLEKRRLATGEL